MTVVDNWGYSFAFVTWWLFLFGMGLRYVVERIGEIPSSVVITAIICLSVSTTIIQVAKHIANTSPQKPSDQ